MTIRYIIYPDFIRKFKLLNCFANSLHSMFAYFISAFFGGISRVKFQKQLVSIDKRKWRWGTVFAYHSSFDKISRVIKSSKIIMHMRNPQKFTQFTGNFFCPIFTDFTVLDFKKRAVGFE